MMDILVNELSLTGQFSSKEEFIENALLPFLRTLKEIKYFDYILLFKKNDLYDCKISGDYSLYDLLHLRGYDEVARSKSLLASLFEKPFWEDDKKHYDTDTYFFNDRLINNTSIAEACERDRIILSFIHEEFKDSIVLVKKGNEPISIDNLFEEGIFTEVLKARGILGFEKYILRKFANSKLDFSEIDQRNGFNKIEKSDENEFLNSFSLFNKMEWAQILTSDSLDYKEYKDQSFFKEYNNKIYKFRVTQKYRCFGFREKDIFYVIRFETDHKLSNKG